MAVTHIYDDIFERIIAQENGVIVNIIQAAAENQGTVEERLNKGYAELVPNAG